MENNQINQIASSNIFHPGELLKEEIESRHIKQIELAKMMGVSHTVLNEILNGKRPITTEFALLLEAALGTPAYIWIGLQTDYNIKVAKQNPSFMEKLREVSRIAATIVAL